MPDLVSIIRERAYFIWEQEGRPQGRAEAHWAAAAEQVQQMMTESSSIARKAARPLKAKPASSPRVKRRAA